ncbi:MAG TPA: UPF0149 family protein [Dokdonella sp.]
MTDSRLQHAELTHTVRSLRLGVDASDLHGSLSGYLCGGACPGETDWLGALEIDLGADLTAAAQSMQLRRLYRECRAQFEESPASIEPLLPDAPLAQRAAGLVEWCRGFLGGFGLSGASLRTDLSTDAREILADLGTIANGNIQTSGSREDEQAFADVLDFACTAAAVLHRELGRAPRRSLH